MLPILYRLLKMHETFNGGRFIVAFRKCNTKPLPDTLSKIFDMIFNTVESLHDKNFFYSACRKFWIVQNSFPIVTKLNKINVKRKTKSSYFNF